MNGPGSEANADTAADTAADADDLRRANAALRHRDALFTACAEGLKRLLAAEDFEVAVVDALRLVGEAARLHRVKVILGRSATADRPAFHELVHEWWAPGLCSQASHGVTSFPDAMLEHDYIGPLRSGMSIFKFIDDVPETLRPGFDRVGMKSMGVVPVFVGRDYAGLLAFDDCVERRVFAPAEMDALTIAGRAIGAAIHRHETQQRDAMRAADLGKANEAMRRSTAKLVSDDKLTKFLDAVLQEAIDAAGAASGVVFVHRPGTDELSAQSLVLHGGPLDIALDERAADWRDSVAAGSNGPWLQMAAARREIWLAPQDGVVEGWPQAGSWHRSQGHCFRVCLPMLHGTEAIGFIALAYEGHEEKRPADSAFELCRVMAQQAALAVRMAELARQARDAAMLNAVVGERGRIAAEIHDSLAQSFTSIALQSESLRCRRQSDAVVADVMRLIERTAREGLAEARSSVLALHTLDAWPGSLDLALKQLAERCTVPGTLGCRFETRGSPCELAADVREALIRIAREATSNAMRHSGGQRVLIALDYAPPRVRLSVHDDGSGPPAEVDETRAGFGLTGMARRAEALGGCFRLRASPHGGTWVEVELPCCAG